ncbi:MAG: hypothetical protein IJN29_02835 [Akkermansia sp.]|nr:hypothetical protein [Akkermansia sp.]
MSTYKSVMEITTAIAPTLQKSEVVKVADEEIDAIDARFKAEGKSANLAGVAKNALASGAKEAAAELANGAKSLGLGCLNLLIPFAALGFFMSGKKKTAITQVVLCCLSAIIVMCVGGVIGGIICGYVVGFLYIAALALWNKIVDAKNQLVDVKNQFAAAKDSLSKINNPFTAHKNLTEKEHFTAPEHYEEYMGLLNEREEHFQAIYKLCK